MASQLSESQLSGSQLSGSQLSGSQLSGSQLSGSQPSVSQPSVSQQTVSQQTVSQLSDLTSAKDVRMRLYYEKVFPFELMVEWLVYGHDEKSEKKKGEKKEEDKKKKEEEDVVMSDAPTFTPSPYADIPFLKYREFACMIDKDGTERVLRYRSFKNAQEMRAEFVRNLPSRIEIGPIYNKPLIPSNRGQWTANERELIFGKLQS